MEFFVISLFICYFLFLFFLYRLGKEDFILIRKNIALEQLFNITLVTTLVGLFFGRLAYVVFHFNTTYLNPLKFFIVPYFPGLIFPAVVIGGYAYIWYLSQLRRLPTGRIIDFYAVAIAGVMPLLTLAQLFLPTTQLVLQLIIAGVWLLTFLLVRFLLLPRVGKGEIKDGTLGLLYISVLSTIDFLQDAFLHTKGFFSFLQFEDVLYLATLLTVIVILYLQEFRQPRKKKAKVA
jgi:hypothetical protein